MAAAGCAPRTSATAGDVHATPLFTAEELPPARIGELELLGAFALRSGDADFGGISAVRRDGASLFLLSDRSTLFEVGWHETASAGAFRLPLRAKRALTDQGGRALDAEALVLERRGDILVGNETDGRIHAFAPAQNVSRDVPIRLPDAFAAGGAANQGLETLVRLPGGGLLAILEGATADGLHAAALLDEAGTRDLAYRGGDGFQVTDADVAGDWLLVLERRLSLFGGWQSRIVAVALDEVLATGQEPISGRELAAIAGPVLGENYEGLAAWAASGGEVGMLLVADDNFSPFQRTQLLELRWRP